MDGAKGQPVITTTDGKAYIFAVFDYDGYECKDLVGVFASEATAESYAAQRRAAAKRSRIGIEDHRARLPSRCWSWIPLHFESVSWKRRNRVRPTPLKPRP